MFILAASSFSATTIPIPASYDFWLVVSLIYCFMAATLPVWVLLQPRDYLSMYILIVGLALGFVSLLVMHPTINGPAFTGFDSAKGPLWPILFITVACGAVSGFHSVVSSGTSAKQLRKESDGRKVAFGGMLTEGALAMLVILLMSSVLYWAIPPSDGCFSVRLPVAALGERTEYHVRDGDGKGDGEYRDPAGVRYGIRCAHAERVHPDDTRHMRPSDPLHRHRDRRPKGPGARTTGTLQLRPDWLRPTS